MLAAHAQGHGRGQVAIREKEFGIWQQVTWADYAAHVRAVCLGLEALGLRRRRGAGHRLRQPAGVALHGAGRPGAGRDPGRCLRRQPARADALHRRALRRADRHGRGPGAGRQSPRRPGPSSEAWSGSWSTTCAASRTTGSRCSSASRRWSASAARRTRANPGTTTRCSSAASRTTWRCSPTRPAPRETRRRRCSATATWWRWPPA